MSIRIIPDSASDITQAEAKELDLTVIPLKTIFGEQEYLDGVTIDHTTFYNKLIEGGYQADLVRVTDAPHEGNFWSEELLNIIFDFIEKNV